MRVMFAVAVLLTGIACVSRAEAQVCGGDCSKCLVYARGECIKRGVDPACAARKERCLAQRKKVAPKSPTTVAPRPSAVPPAQTGRQPYVRRPLPTPSAVPPAPSAPNSAPIIVPPASTGIPAPKSVPTAVPPAPTGVPGPRLVPARVYLRAADIPPASIGAYGVVALRTKATPANRERLLRTCIAYRASLPPQRTLPSSIPPSNQMLTIWPLDDPDASEALKDDCNFVVDHYDLVGGILAIQDASRHQGANLEGIGPFLIGWSPSNARGVPDKVVLIFDLSRLESQASFDEAFTIWQKRIVENPTLWVSGFSVTKIRLALRDFVDHYGTDVVKFWGGKN
jgi:hypothetical protein